MHDRKGFTLVELLVAVAIIVFLTVLTVTTLNFAAQKARIPESARSAASFLEGARDRAIHDRKPVGVRFLLDENGPRNSAGNPITCSSFLYVHSLDPIETVVSIGEDQRTLIFYTTGNDGTVGVAGVDDDTDGTADNTADELGAAASDDVYTGDSWDFIEGRGLFYNRGTEIVLTLATGQKTRFVVIKNGANWELTRDIGGTFTPLGQRLDLKMVFTPSIPAVMPNQTPRELARGVVIDLETSRVAGRIPADWYDSATSSYSDTMDIAFRPDGKPIVSVQGVLSLNLVVADAADIETTNWLSGSNPFYSIASRPNAAQERLVTVGMMTGKIGSAMIKLEDSNGDDIPDDPFFYAETGKHGNR